MDRPCELRPQQPTPFDGEEAGWESPCLTPTPTEQIGFLSVCACQATVPSVGGPRAAKLQKPPHGKHHVHPVITHLHAPWAKFKLIRWQAPRRFLFFNRAPSIWRGRAVLTRQRSKAPNSTIKKILLCLHFVACVTGEWEQRQIIRRQGELPRASVLYEQTCSIPENTTTEMVVVLGPTPSMEFENVYCARCCLKSRD